MRIKPKYKVSKNRDANELLHYGVNAGRVSWRESSSKINSSGELNLLKHIWNSIMVDIYHIVA